MKHIKMTIVTIMFTGLLIVISAAQSPILVNYQGYLTDADGQALTGDQQITFLLYEKLEGGLDLWNETQTVTLENGLFNVLLGSADSTLAIEHLNGERFLGIKIGEEDELEPRMRLASVTHSVMATRAEGAYTLDAPGNGPTDVVYVDNDGNVGIGNNNPQANLDVSGKVISDNMMIKVHEGYANAVKSYHIENLDGNTHKIYKIYFHGYITTSQDVYLNIRPNRDAGSNYRSWMRNDGDVSGWQGPYANWGIMMGRSAWNRSVHISYEITLFAGSGQDRFGVGTGAMWDTAQPTAGFIMLQSWGKWHNTVDNITSITIAALNPSGGETTAGSFSGTVIVYALLAR